MAIVKLLNPKYGSFSHGLPVLAVAMAPILPYIALCTLLLTFIIMQGMIAQVSCFLVYFFAGPPMIEKLLQGKGVIMVLVLLLMVALALVYTMHHQMLRHRTQKASLPDIPMAFTGRHDKIQLFIHYLVAEHVRVVSVTGGPGYGKSSVAIIGSHELVQLGIPVYYVSLSEVSGIDTFIMAFMHATDKRKTERMPERGELLSWISSLQTKTVVVLDNADLLTLTQIELRNDFQKMLKDIVSGSAHIHLVVATRYRLQIVNNFKEIHLNPLTNSEAVLLLTRVIGPQKHASNGKVGSLEHEHLKIIANETGGIPLALKVVGILVESGIVSTAQVLEELAVDPLHAFSRDSLTPDEQLNRCFNLSYKYLSPIMKKCLIYASRFPGTFDRRARDAIITNITGDAHCLDQLVDRSLVEYSTVDERYTMHSLLRTFVIKSVQGQPSEHKYCRLYCSHFTLLLSRLITEARTSGDVNPLYTTITADYHNFLHLLYIYTKGSKHHACLAHKDMLLFASQSFNVMKSRFPWEVLMDWWTVVLKNICRRMPIAEFEQLATRFLQLSTKFGNLLLSHQLYQLAGDILLFADQCVNSTSLAASFSTCQHPQADSYTGMLQALMRVYKENGLEHKVLQVRERLHHCIDSAPERKPEQLIQDYFCTVGITYIWEKHSQNKSFDIAVQLFDAHFICSSQSEERFDNLIMMIEEAYERDYQQPLQDSFSQVAKVLTIAKRCNMVKDYRKESVWLMKVATVMELSPENLGSIEMISVHFRLAHLQWDLGNAEKAVEHGLTAYYLAIMYPEEHYDICTTSLRLGDILHQIDGRQTEAGFYFEKALYHLPFLDVDESFIFMLQHVVELHLISIHFHLGEHRQCIQHYGQWAKLNAASTLDAARKLVAALFTEAAQEKNGQGLALIDSSLDWLFGDTNIAKRFLHAFVHKAHSSTIYYAKVFAFTLLTFGGVCLLIISAIFISMVCGYISCLTLIFTQMAYFIFLPHFCLHYFLYQALVEHRVWAPRQLPQYPPQIMPIYTITLFLFSVLGAPIMWISSVFGIFLLGDQVGNVYSPYSLHYNFSMFIPDETFYELYISVR